MCTSQINRRGRKSWREEEGRRLKRGGEVEKGEVERERIQVISAAHAHGSANPEPRGLRHVQTCDVVATHIPRAVPFAYLKIKKNQKSKKEGI
jgi:hypothetical protein